uniref:Ig-like domain-containing protein n=1 Tax=Echeneis naucrates TaxID=173247 RepID=A0A665TFT6_ECHNA
MINCITLSETHKKKNEDKDWRGRSSRLHGLRGAGSWRRYEQVFSQTQQLFSLCITALPGENVSLPCQVSNMNFTVLNWSRSDLLPQYVFMYKDKKPLSENQHPSFAGRVELEDKHMKDGNISVTLKNVTTNDSGTYTCEVIWNRTKLREIISRVNLAAVVHFSDVSCSTQLVIRLQKSLMTSHSFESDVLVQETSKTCRTAALRPRPQI